MERRAGRRFDIDQPARLTLLDGNQAAAIAARVVNTSGTGLGLTLEEAVPPGASVRVDCGNALFLGEVRYCRPCGGGFSAGLQVEHALYNLPGLAALARELLEEQPVTPRSRVAPHNRP